MNEQQTYIATLDALFPNGETFEIRAITKRGTFRRVSSGWYRDHSKAVAAAAKLSKAVDGVYVTMNPVDPALIARANERIVDGVEATADKHIPRLQRLLIDCDAKRPAGISSTEAEHKAALAVAEKIKGDLTSKGWPQPLLHADSSNGAHLLYNIDLPNDRASTDLIQQVLVSLNDRFGTSAISIDKTNFNAARIVKLYGSISRKGDNTPDRPHRRSRVLAISETRTVKVDELRAEVRHEEDTRGKATPDALFDVADYLTKHGRAMTGTKRIDKGTIYLLSECVFNPEHKDAGIIQYDAGDLAYRCFHDSCQGKTWRDAREVISGDEKIGSRPQSDAGGDSEKDPQAAKILRLAADLELFIDQHEMPHVFLNKECLPLSAEKVKQWLAHKFYLQHGRGCNSDAMNQALNVLKGKALYGGNSKTLHNRIAWHNGNIVYDMRDGTVARITPKGWTIRADFPPLFRRYTHQVPQVKPVPGGDISAVIPFLNIENDHALLCLVYLVSLFVPDIPHPIFHPHGAQGSGKTTTCKIIKSITDPSSIDTMMTPKDREQLIQIIAHHQTCLFDNMSELPGWMSDILAMAATGGGIQKRRLYTDDDSFIYQVKRGIGLNGINSLITRPDLMDRAILLPMERIKKGKRKTDRSLEAAFTKALPGILGGVFDILSRALAIHSNIRLDQYERMADFTEWGVAIAEAMKQGGRTFLSQYQANIATQSDEIVRASSLAQAVLMLMMGKDEWTGTVKAAYEALGALVQVSKGDKTFPGAANKLRQALRRIQSTLEEQGIVYRIDDKPGEDGYHITFSRQKEENLSSVSSADDLDNNFNDFWAEDTAEHTDKVSSAEHTEKVSSGVSSGAKSSKNNGKDDPEHTEDKNVPFWSDVDDPMYKVVRDEDFD